MTESRRNMFHLEPGLEIQFHKNQEREGDDITMLLNSLPTKMFVRLFVFLVATFRFLSQHFSLHHVVGSLLT